MDFKGQYLTFDEYEELEGTLKEVPFNLLEYDARKLIDQRTVGRLKSIKRQCFEVKMCVFKMIKIKERYQTLKNQDQTLASVGTDGYSESYRKLEKNDVELEEKELMDIIETDLANVIVDEVPVLYPGVDVC